MECIIQTIRQPIVNCFLIRHEGAILVDSGTRGNADAVLRAAAGLGLTSAGHPPHRPDPRALGPRGRLPSRSPPAPARPSPCMSRMRARWSRG